MKIAVSTENGYVSAHFGRCPTYTVIDIQDRQITHKEEINNPGHRPGFLPEFLGAQGVDLIIAGGMGPRAQGLFAQKNIQTIIGVQGRVDEVIEKYIQGQLEPGEDLCDHGHEDHMKHEPRYFQENHPEPLKTGSIICITALGDTIDSEVDSKFGRAHYFLFLSPGSDQLKVFPNPNKDMAHGAGIQSAQFVASKNPSLIISGEVGPNAERVLRESGVRMITGVKGKVRDVLKEFLEKEKSNVK